jgi:hypothetical protein
MIPNTYHCIISNITVNLNKMISCKTIKGLFTLLLYGCMFRIDDDDDDNFCYVF